jgi:uncharacterized repeat protein (TIGR01451 family)
MSRFVARALVFVVAAASTGGAALAQAPAPPVPPTILVPPTDRVPPVVVVPPVIVGSPIVIDPIVIFPPRSGGLLKVCKVGGPGIPVGTPFTVTAGGNTFTVPSGPAPGGTCVVGPSFPVGTHVTVAETIPAGILVSSIAVAPSVRLDGPPNTASGSANITIGSGVTEVTFTNKRTGFLEICKTGEVQGNFSFSVNPGDLGPYVVPAGACSPAIEVAAGVVTIHELPSTGSAMSGCTTIPPAQQGACNLDAQISTVTVAPGDISTMTIAFIANKKIDVSLDKKFTSGPTRGTGAFTLLVKNEGAPIAAGTIIKITDPVPLGVTLTGFGGTSGTNWSCTPAFSVTGPATLTCSYTGTGIIASGAVLPALILNATLAADGSQTGIYGNCATVALSTAAGPVTEGNTANNRACAVTQVINPAGCETGKCPQPQAVCKQDVLFVVDNSRSIGGGLSTVTNAISKFLQPMQNKGGSANIFSFNGGYGTNTPSWNQITTGTNGWVPVTNSNWSALANVTSLGGSRTDWDDALKHASTVAPTAPLVPPLVLFLTDGKPTAYVDNTTGMEIDATNTSVTAATEAVQWINAIRAAGSPIIAIGFGPDVSSGYIDAAFTGNISGPGSINFETSSVIKMESVNNLSGVMEALGNQMCGTLSLNKRGGGYFQHVIQSGTPLSINDNVTFSIDITNNSGITAMNSVVVQDKVQSVLSSVTLATGSPTAGSATIMPVLGNANLITWQIPTLAPRQTATLSFSGKFSKIYTARITESFLNYAQVTGAANYNATDLNSMDQDNGPVREVDESVAGFTEDIIPPPVDTCLPADRPVECYVRVSKVRKFPGAEDGSCTSLPTGSAPANPCTFTIDVTILPTYVPTGSVVNFMDTYTVNGTSTSVPLNPVAPATMCPTPPATVPFTCSHGSTTNFSGDLTIMIPVGQNGPKSNCFTVTIPSLNVSRQACVAF